MGLQNLSWTDAAFPYLNNPTVVSVGFGLGEISGTGEFALLVALVAVPVPPYAVAPSVTRASLSTYAAILPAAGGSRRARWPAAHTLT